LLTEESIKNRILKDIELAFYVEERIILGSNLKYFGKKKIFLILKNQLFILFMLMKAAKWEISIMSLLLDTFGKKYSINDRENLKSLNICNFSLKKPLRIF